MASTCFTLLRVPAIRATQLDACGNVVEGECAQVTSSGITTVEQAVEQEDRQDYFALNADAQPCITDTAPPILKWINLTLTFCQVDVNMITLLTGEPIVFDDSTEPVAIGWDTAVGSVDTVNFALETWTRIGGSNACGPNGLPSYGYLLLPWITEGVMGDVTLENGAASMTVTARTNAGGGWGEGPYAVRLSNATATDGQAMPLLTPIGPLVHRRLFITELAPPTAACGCGPLPAGPLALVAGAAELVTLTLPTSPAPVYPATVDWGDGNTTLVTSGTPTTKTHTYAAPGTWNVTLASNVQSGPFWTGSVTSHA